MPPPWNPLDYPLTLGLTLVAALICAVAVAFRPRLLWPLLLFVPLATAQIKMGRYCITDEIVVFALLAGAVVATGSTRLRHGPALRKNPHGVLFLVMIGYMIFQSLRGMAVNSDIRMLRWAAYYAMFGLFFLVTDRWEYPRPSPRKATLVAALMLIVSLGAYLLFGLYSVEVLGVGRWDTQADMWAGSAAAVFPVVVGLPAGFFCMADKSRLRRLLGILVFAITVAAANYYDCRIALISAAAFLAASTLVMRKRTIVILVGSLLAGYIISHPPERHAISSYVEEYFTHPAQALISPDGSDEGRHVAFYAGWDTALSDWRLALVGGGMYSHKTLMPAYVDEQFGRFPGGPARFGYANTTAGFSALLVDTGLIGVFLLGANFWATFRRILRMRSSAPRRHKILLTTALGLIALWPIICNILDHVLLYLAIMPGGVLTLLGGDSAPVLARARMMPQALRLNRDLTRSHA